MACISNWLGEIQTVDSNKWAGTQNDLHSPLKMLVLDDIVLLWTGKGVMGYSNRSQAACQAVNIDSAVVLLVCDMAG